MTDSRTAVVHDSQGNTISVVGPAVLQKRNPTGALVWNYALAVKDENHVVRALAIDAIDRIYVGVSEGGDQGEAWIRCLEPDRDKKLVKVWEIKPGAYTEKLVIREDKLYAAQNVTDAARSRYIVYEDLANRAGPTVAVTKIDLPYPLHDLDVNPDGEVLTASAPRTAVAPDRRFYDPRAPQHSAILDDQRWTPTKLSNWEERKWAWFSAEDLPGTDLRYKNDQDISEWEDTRGRGVCRLKADPTKAQFKAPRFKEHGLAYKPTVQFDGNWYRLVTEGSVGNTTALNDVQPTLLPGKGRGYLIVFVIQPVEDTNKTGRIFSQENDNSGGVRELYINTGANATGTHQGGISPIVARKTATAGTTDPLTVIGEFTNKNSAAIVSILCNNDVCGAGFQNGCFRVNGVPVAQFDTDDFWTNAGNQSVVGCKSDGTSGPVVGISEIFVLQSYTDPADSLHKVCTFPQVDATADAGTFDATTTDTELERIEGYFAWKYGISHLLDDGAESSGSSPSWDTEGGHSQFEHPFTSSETAAGDSTLSPPNPNGRGSDTWDLALLNNNGVTAKWSAQRGSLKWAYQGAGMGYFVAASSGRAVFTGGPRTNNATFGNNATSIRRINDNGTAASFVWTYLILDSGGSAVDMTYEYPRVAVDSFDNLWFPFQADDAATQYSLLGFAQASGTPFLLYRTTSDLPGQAVSVDPRLPDYSTNPTTITRPEFVVLATSNDGNTSNATLHQVRLVTATNNDANQRSVQYVAVAGGDIKVFQPNGTVTLVGAGSLDATSRFVDAVEAFSKVFFTDGKQYRYYDPKTGLVSEWAATDGGAMLPRFQLLCLWDGRLVLARGPEQPANWQMSEKGNPFGWDFFPPDGPLVTQAVAGSNSETGLVPDVITALIPESQERLIFGGDHSIHAMFGNPMENGFISLVSDITGIAYGSAWARDSDGLIYFFGTRGGVYVMNGSLGVTKLSTKSIDRRLQQVDMALYHLALRWDEDQHELRVWQTPQGESETIIASWTWCKRTGSWWQDRASVFDVQPTCAAVFDSDDPDDRVLVIGCSDGFVRKIDRTARDDDGYAIHSYVVMGPYMGGSSEARIRNPKVTLASELDGARLEFFSSDVADSLGTSQGSFDLRPGQNPRWLFGVRGAAAWLKLANGAAGQSWAFEGGHLEIYEAGRKVAQR